MRFSKLASPLLLSFASLASVVSFACSSPAPAEGPASARSAPAQAPSVPQARDARSNVLVPLAGPATTVSTAQVRQALENIVTVIAEAGGLPQHIVRLTWYVTSRDEYCAELAEIGAAYRAVMGKNFPVMSVVQVVALVESQAKVEIEATAVVPD